MKKKIQVDKQKVALVGLLIAVAIGGYMLINNSPEAEAASPIVEQTPAQTEAQKPVEVAPTESLGSSSSGLGR